MKQKGMKNSSLILNLMQKVLFDDNEFIIPIFFLVSFLVNSLKTSPSFVFIIIRVFLAVSLSLLLKFRKKIPAMTVLSNFYWFWEGLIFLNFEFLYYDSKLIFSRAIFALVRFMTISGLMFVRIIQDKKRKSMLMTITLLAFNLIITNSILDHLSLPVLIIELVVFFFSFGSQVLKQEKNTNESFSEILNFLPMGFIVVKKSKNINHDYTIESFNDKSLSLLGVEKKELSVPFLVSEMKTFRFSNRTFEEKNDFDHSSWTLHEFQNFFKKSDDILLLRLKKNFLLTTEYENISKYSMNTHKLPTIKNDELNQNTINQPNFSIIEFHSRKISHDLKISIKHSCDQSVIYILISEIDTIEELKSKNEQKTRLINSFSHELKTPLNASIPMLEICKQEKNAETMNLYIEKIICCLKFLELALNNILDYSLIMSEEFILNFSQFPLRVILKDIHEIISEKITLKGLEYKWDLQFEANLSTDYVRLKQILLNLVLNSIQFTETGGIISLEIEKVTETPLKLNFKIIDNGIGISKEKLSKLKDNLKFNSEIPINSTGSCLGLIISYNISILLGGEPLKIESEINKGTIVSFNLIEQNLEKLDSDENEMLMSKKKSKTNAILRDSRTFSSSKTKKFVEETGSRKREKNINFKSMKYAAQKCDNYYFHHSEKILCKKNKVDKPTHKPQVLDKSKNNISIPDISLNHEIEMHNFEDLVKLKSENSKMHQENQLFSESNEIKNDDEQDLKSESDSEMQICNCPEVLIVDDDPFNLFSLEVLLKKLNCSCIKALNGIKAINILQNYKYCCEDCKGIQLIIMDYQMPELDGVETTEKIEIMIEKGEIRDAQIVGCTAFCAKTEVFRMMDAGMIDVIFKPLNIDILKGVLNKVMKTKL